MNPTLKERAEAVARFQSQEPDSAGLVAAHYEALVRKEASRSLRSLPSKSDQDDLLQDLRLRLFECLASYDAAARGAEGRSAAFISYLVPALRHEIATAWFRRKGGVVAKRTNTGRFQDGMRAVARHLRMERGARTGNLQDAVDSACAEVGGFSPWEASVLSSLFSRPVALDAPVGIEGGEEEATLQDVLADGSPDPEEILLQSEIQSKVRDLFEEAVAKMKEPHKEMLRARFFEDPRPTLQEIGDLHGLSKQSISFLEHRALRLLRDLCAAKGIQSVDFGL